MHAYAKDLADFRTLVNSRGVDTEVHICVDAQTGLGTWPPRPYSENIGTATTVSHRVEKQRMLENFIMEIMLTATNTFTLRWRPTTFTLATVTGNTSHNRSTTSSRLTTD